MATKRSKRIDPNAAFAAIVGASEASVPQPLDPASGEGAGPAPAPQEGACTVSDDAAIDAIGADVMDNQPASVPRPGQRPPAAASALQATLAENLQQAGEAIPNRQESPKAASAEFAAVQQPAGEAAPGPAPRLVQKGYYITEEQHKRLGLFAVMQGTDRSAIVRKALDMYFDANKEQL